MHTQPRNPDQFPAERIKSEIVSPYKNNWILFIAITIFSLAFFVYLFPEELQVCRWMCIFKCVYVSGGIEKIHTDSRSIDRSLPDPHALSLGHTTAAHAADPRLRDGRAHPRAAQVETHRQTQRETHTQA